MDVSSEVEIRVKQAAWVVYECISHVTGLSSYRSSWDFKTCNDLKITRQGLPWNFPNIRINAVTHIHTYIYSSSSLAEIYHPTYIADFNFNLA